MKSKKSFFLRSLLIFIGIAYSASIYAVTVFTAKNEDGVTIRYQTMSSNQALVLSGGAYSGHVKIPATVVHEEQEYVVSALSSSCFKDCSSLTSVSIPETIGSISDYAFNGCVSLTIAELPETITSIGNDAFSGCNHLTNFDIPNSVKTIGVYAFYGCTALKRVSIPKSVRSIGGFAFGNCSSLETIITEVEEPFELSSVFGLISDNATLYVPYGTKEAYQKTEGWNVFENIEEMENPVGSNVYALWCEGNASLYFLTSDEPFNVGDLYNGQTISMVWKGSEITETGEKTPEWNAFVRGTLTNVVFESSFKDVKLTSTYQWFLGCQKLEAIEGIANLNTSEVTTMRAMFSSCESLKSIDVTGFNTAKVTSMRNMFANCKKLKQVVVTHFDTGAVEDMTGMFRGCSSLTYLDLNNFDTRNATSMQSMFYECGLLTDVEVSSFVTDNVKDMAWMFYGCSALTDLDLSHFNMNHVTNLRTMFGECHNLKSLNISGWNTQEAENMRSLFVDCMKLKQLTIDNLNTKKVKTMALMFYNCKSLPSLNISSFDTGSVEQIDSMFFNCNNLQAILVGDGWIIDETVSSENMFQKCISVLGEKGTTYFSNYVDDTYARIDADGAPGYFRTSELTTTVPILNLTCFAGCWMQYMDEMVTNCSKSFQVNPGSDVVVEYGTYEGYNIGRGPVFNTKGSTSVAYNTHQCFIYDMQGTVSISLDTETSVSDVHDTSASQDAWYTLQGVRLQHKPDKRGIYIHQGKKVLVK